MFVVWNNSYLTKENWNKSKTILKCPCFHRFQLFQMWYCLCELNSINSHFYNLRLRTDIKFSSISLTLLIRLNISILNKSRKFSHTVNLGSFAALNVTTEFVSKIIFEIIIDWCIPINVRSEPSKTWFSRYIMKIIIGHLKTQKRKYFETIFGSG